MIRLALLLSAIALLGAAQRGSAQASTDPWTSEFLVDRTRLVATGASRYFILDPGYEAVLEHGAERVVVTVTGETRVVDGVTTRVIEERETHGKALVEVSRNFVARDPSTGDVYYFGEDVDIYKNGRVTGHEGGWQAGKNGARFGLFMPGSPAAGRRFYQEMAPDVALDRVRITATDATVQTPAGVFKQCVRVEETTPLEPGVKDYKLFAPGVGLVQDGSLKLVRYGRR